MDTNSNSQLQAPYSETPPQLTHKLVENSEEFETVCDQIYYILEQSKRVLQLDYQQKIIQQKELENQHQMEKMDNEPHDPMQVDQEMEFGTTQLDLSMDDEQVDTNKQKPVTIDEEDMEELLHIQRDRLDRLKNVIVFGMDADAAKANGSDEKIEDLLF
ncbi:uncharacterized protein B0P05DRAFT_97742 [Gilbertella persicaria]|uniref:uncharacterized protein n=1 Tax=Gilbertella persicaria TaxID=101096 RepID=UPI00221EEA12|nr:uncharacterized protein B0P05DRAFT_97742 [Gilbertella persicaria]KAI8097959.1 hypothetical protein B0P05DRAFT_97742 [Gilbertella persicaria]